MASSRARRTAAAACSLRKRQRTRVVVALGSSVAEPYEPSAELLSPVATAGRLIDHLHRSYLDVRDRCRGTATALGLPEPSRPSLPARHSEGAAPDGSPTRGVGVPACRRRPRDPFPRRSRTPRVQRDGSLGVATRSSFFLFSRNRMFFSRHKRIYLAIKQKVYMST